LCWMGKYKLTYFNAMGRAEIIRLVFAQAGVEFEDIRIEKSDWPALKEKMPFGQLPVLQEDDRMLAQSTAIATYLAKKFGLDGADDWEAAKIQELFGVTSDLVNHAIPFWITTDENEKKKQMDEFEKEHLAPLFVRLDKILQQNGSGFFVGKKLTVADLNMLCIIGLFSSMFPNTAAKHPHLTEFKEKIMSLPNIKRWIESRPKTDF
uniref:Glutathione S-transferase 1 n=1 Tax=Parascaris univalens TaxID=6257 RepID=A0A915C0I1_PARUN